jgi:hypothetical protein
MLETCRWWMTQWRLLPAAAALQCAALLLR